MSNMEIIGICVLIVPVVLVVFLIKRSSSKIIHGFAEGRDATNARRDAQFAAEKNEKLVQVNTGLIAENKQLSGELAHLKSELEELKRRQQ